MSPNPVDYKEINWQEVEKILKMENIDFELKDNPVGWTSGQGFVNKNLFVFSKYLESSCAMLSIDGKELFKPLILAVSKVIMDNKLPRLAYEEGLDNRSHTVYWCSPEQLVLVYDVLQTQQKCNIRSIEEEELTT
ncbi:MAG: hypothetical protein UR64_C0026G0012 [Candidatus Nomurabacteria bacterium GW2011_GWE1_35_16]|uniref:Uncharacterized protein n=1 Tax=Candidatus Nomurabacteria bacterium GW2011_GWE1_35_16 TaxID=1618761 RepID=A0A0G0B826_9BACT|nr:MAG: hypothetical protein UR64_C0026G0012 [Candidatus Nomurabacteria bacterium GW2011_GWE1_35_16]